MEIVPCRRNRIEQFECCHSTESLLLEKHFLDICSTHSQTSRHHYQSNDHTQALLRHMHKHQITEKSNTIKKLNVLRSL